MAINTEFQAVCRIYRELQEQGCKIVRLIQHNTFDKYRENKATMKIFGEIAGWSSGRICQLNMIRLLIDSGVPMDKVDLQLPGQFEIAARGLVQEMLGQRGSRETGSAHVVYNHLKRTAYQFERT